MKDIGEIDKKVTSLERIVKRHDIELTGLAQRIYKTDGSITLNISIFTDDFTTTLRADYKNRYFNAAINTVEGYCSPRFNKNIIPIQLQNTTDVSVSGSFVTTKNTEETMINQLGVSHFNTVNLAEASVDTGRITVTPEVIYDYSNSNDSGGDSSESDIRLKSNIKRIGTHKLGIGIYEYDIFNRRETGLIAQEVLNVKPDAVGKNIYGYLTVNYSKMKFRRKVLKTNL